MKNTLIVLLGAALAVILGLYAFMWLGVYDMGADSPHRKTTVSMLTMMRERSIERHDAGRVPGHRRQGAARRRHGADGSRRDDIHLSTTP